MQTDKNAKMAEAMGWKLDDTREQLPELRQYLNRRGKSFGVRSFSTSHDALRTHVLPELERRRLLGHWANEVDDLLDGESLAKLQDDSGINWDTAARLMTAPASVWLDAALAAMGVE